MRKCIVCGKWIPEEEMGNAVPYKKRFAHKGCFNQMMKTLKINKDEELKDKQEKKKTQKTTPKVELKNGLSDEEYREKREYYDYLKQILNTDKLSAKVYTLSEKYLNQFNSWSWKGMKDALVYMYEIKEKEITGDVVGYLPYIYEEAVKFFEEVKRVEANNKKVSLSDMYKTKKIIYHKKPQKIVEDLVIESINKSK